MLCLWKNYCFSNPSSGCRFPIDTLIIHKCIACMFFSQWKRLSSGKSPGLHAYRSASSSAHDTTVLPHQPCTISWLSAVYCRKRSESGSNIMCTRKVLPSDYFCMIIPGSLVFAPRPCLLVRRVFWLTHKLLTCLRSVVLVRDDWQRTVWHGNGQHLPWTLFFLGANAPNNRWPLLSTVLITLYNTSWRTHFCKDSNCFT